MKPKLLLLSSLYPNAVNPVRGTFVREQVEAFTGDYEVRVIAWDFPSKALHEHRRDGQIQVDYIRFPALKGFFPSSIPAFWYYVLPVVKEIISAWKPDIIQVHDYAHLPGLYVLKGVLDKYDIPKFLTLHNLKSLPGLMNHQTTNFIYTNTLPKALHGWTRIFTVNHSLAEQAGKYGSPTECIGNGVPDAIRLDSDALQKIRDWLGAGSAKVLSVGNLIPSKGFDMLIRSVQALKEEGLQVRTLIVGDGQEHTALQELVAELGLGNEVWIYGAMAHDEVRSLYYDFDIFALPSHNETFGIVYLEASWAGIPSIGVRGQGIWGLFAENTEALFMEPGEQDSLTALLRRLAMNPSERIVIGANAHKRCEQDYRLDSILNKVKDRYREALS